MSFSVQKENKYHSKRVQINNWIQQNELVKSSMNLKNDLDECLTYFKLLFESTQFLNIFFRTA